MSKNIIITKNLFLYKNLFYIQKKKVFGKPMYKITHQEGTFGYAKINKKESYHLPCLGFYLSSDRIYGLRIYESNKNESCPHFYSYAKRGYPPDIGIDTNDFKKLKEFCE
jgi:hypothetical protein